VEGPLPAPRQRFQNTVNPASSGTIRAARGSHISPLTTDLWMTKRCELCKSRVSLRRNGHPTFSLLKTPNRDRSSLKPRTLLNSPITTASPSRHCLLPESQCHGAAARPLMVPRTKLQRLFHRFNRSIHLRISSTPTGSGTREPMGGIRLRSRWLMRCRSTELVGLLEQSDGHL
jgi:hypothetical protein